MTMETMNTRDAIEMAIDALIECGQIHHANAKQYLAAIERLRQVNAQCGMEILEPTADALPEAIDVWIDG